MDSSNIPDILYDAQGNAYSVTKPFVPDADCWVQVHPAKAGTQKSILPSDWVARHYTGDNWPTIKSSGIELECAGADREQAEAIAAILVAATTVKE